MAPVWLQALCGGIGTLCFALMLVPQVVLNTRRRSTEGLSWGLVVPWHVAGILFVGVTLAHTQPSWFSALSMFMQVFCCGICEVQMYFFHRVEKGCHRRLLMTAAYTVLTALSCLACAGCYLFFITTGDQLDFILGELAPSILIGLGFFPEFHEFVSSMSIEGYSFGVTFFDVVGSAGNAALYFMREEEPWSERVSEAAPFLTIIFMHVILLILAAWVVCHASRTKALKDASDPNAPSSAPSEDSEASTEVDTAQSETPTPLEV